jgi:hypothetical protein
MPNEALIYFKALLWVSSGKKKKKRNEKIAISGHKSNWIHLEITSDPR